MESRINKKNIGQFSKQFAKLSRKASAHQNLYFVAGAKQAGKSVFVGLICGKELTYMQDAQASINIIVESDNILHEYPPIHSDSQNNIAAIESFLLQQDQQENSIQIAKLAMAQTIIPLVKQIGFILIIDASQIQSILDHLGIFLKLSGITQDKQSPAINIINPLTYLIITKAEDSLEAYIQIFQQLNSQTENQNLSILLQFLIKNNHISIIPLQSPDPRLGINFRQSLKLQKFQHKSLLNILSNSTLKRQQLSLDSINNILDNAEKIVVLVISMILYSGGDKKAKQVYERIAKQIYSESKNKRTIDTMIGNWKKKLFSSTGLKKLSSKNSLEQLKALLDILTELLMNIQNHSPAAKDDLKEIQSQLMYFSSLTHWFNNYIAPTWVTQNANKLQAFLNSNSSPEIEVKPQVQSRIIRSKALGQFCNSLQMCKANGDVLKQCIQRLSQKKNSLAPFQWRIIRDLLQEFQNSINYPIFLPQLIDFSILMNDDYHCELYIKKALTFQTLSEHYVRHLIKILHKPRPALCQLLVDYILGITNNKQTFDNYLGLKLQVKMQSHRLFLERQKQQGASNNSICQNYQLLIGYNKIVDKNHGNAKFTKFLQGKDYQRYLSPLQ